MLELDRGRGLAIIDATAKKSTLYNIFRGTGGGELTRGEGGVSIPNCQLYLRHLCGILIVGQGGNTQSSGSSD